MVLFGAMPPQRTHRCVDILFNRLVSAIGRNLFWTHLEPPDDSW